MGTSGAKKIRVQGMQVHVRHRAVGGHRSLGEHLSTKKAARMPGFVLTEIQILLDVFQIQDLE